MNNNNIPRRPVGPVRQHSLQQPPRRQQQIRRQRSTEDESLQIYSTNSLISRNKFVNNASKCDHHRHISILDRPTVRLAWGEQSNKTKNDGAVEIVARQIPAGKSSRPTTGRGNRGGIGRCSFGEKATILYSRQELAERLRLAWKQREENKSNIDIFLAHNTVEERCDSRLSTATNQTTLPTPKIQKKNVNSTENQVQPIEIQTKVEDNIKKKELENKEIQGLDGQRFQAWFQTSLESHESSINISSSEEQTTDDNILITNKNKENDEEITTEKLTEKEITIEKKSISINCNDWNASIIISNKKESTGECETESSSPPSATKEPDYSQAKLKRASYQSGLNKAFTGPIIEKPSTPRISSRVSTSQELPRFRRTSSAPPQRRTQVNIVIDTPGIPTRLTDNEFERQIISAGEQTQPILKNSITANRPIKSAPPVKRRTKTSKRRNFSVAYSKDGEEDVGTEDGRLKTKGAKSGKNMLELKNTDVVTMVSLVSSADSESELDENSPRGDKLINELRNKLPTTPIIKSSNGLAGGIRKPFKSVSFQQNSFECDSPPRAEEATSTSASKTTSLQARFVALSRANNAFTSPDDTPLLTAATMTMAAWRAVEPSPPLLQLQSAKPLPEETTASSHEAPLTDREKRCLAVPIGDVYDKKRKLVRCRSAVNAPRATDVEKPSSDTNQTCLQTELRMSQVNPQTNECSQGSSPSKIERNSLMPTSEVNVEKEKNLPAEPYCQTPKEKECWHLYKRMCDKGVFVSFDTVLRGMLTPTEYRLRQKEMSQNC